MKLQLGLVHLEAHRLRWEDYRHAETHLRLSAGEIRDQVIQGPLFMAYRGDRITSEEDFEIQPLCRGPNIITFDGRLDNRHELFAIAGIQPSHIISDPELVLRGYERHGDDFFKTLVGEYALVLWSALNRSVRFARSACGARTLYYTIWRDILYWATDIVALIRSSQRELNVNERYLVQHLSSQPSAFESPFRDVFPASPNRVMAFEDGHLKSSAEIWDPTNIPQDLLETDADYEERLRDLVRSAVESRMRSKAQVFSELSGGLDSSTVVLTGDRLLRDAGRNPEDLQTVSCVYDQSATCDESRFIETVEAARAVPTHRISEEDQEISTGLEESPDFSGVPNPLHCFPGRYRTISKIMRKAGARVLLTGMGGDHLFWSDLDGSAIVADALFHCRFGEAFRLGKAWSRQANMPIYELFFGRSLPQARDGRMGRPSRFLAPKPHVWLHSSCRKQFLSAETSFHEFGAWRALPSKRAQLFVCEHFFKSTCSGFFTEYPRLCVSHPYSYRPLVEFCLSTPIHQFLRNGETRSLMRRAFRHLLPPRIVRRVSKGLLDESMAKALQKETARTRWDLNRWEVCQREYVDPDQLQKSIEQVRLGMLDDAGPLFRLFSLERWLRSLRNVYPAAKTESSVQVSGHAAAARI